MLASVSVTTCAKSGIYTEKREEGQNSRRYRGGAYRDGRDKPGHDVNWHEFTPVAQATPKVRRVSRTCWREAPLSLFEDVYAWPLGPRCRSPIGRLASGAGAVCLCAIARGARPTVGLFYAFGMPICLHARRNWVRAGAFGSQASIADHARSLRKLAAFAGQWRERFVTGLAANDLPRKLGPVKD
jgi:hypothetical protein